MKLTHNYDLENFDVQYIESEKEIHVFNDEHVWIYDATRWHWNCTRKASESDTDYKNNLLSCCFEFNFKGVNDRKSQDLANFLGVQGRIDHEIQKLEDSVIFKDSSKN